MISKKNFIFTVLALCFLAGCSGSSSGPIPLANPAGEYSQFPFLYSTDNALYMSWIEGESAEKSLRYARYADGNWNEPVTIAADSGWFVNWADFPSIIANDNGPIAAHWLNKKTGGTYAYDVNIAVPQPTGEWSSAITPHHDSTATEHGFVSMIPWHNNTILAVWLDGRQTAGASGKELYDLNNAMTLRAAIISEEGTVEKSFLIDNSVCDCCQTSLVKTSDGALVAYRNRTDNEIRDIYVSRFDDQSWSQPKVIYEDDWNIGACPVNGPALASSASTVVAGWHTGANDSPSVKLASSTDGGRSFKNVKTINTNESVGRVDAVIHNGTTYISWMERKSGKTQLRVSSLDDQNKKEKTITVDTIKGARKSGFPQMEVMNNQLFFAWTKADSTSPKITTKRILLPLGK
ncbi:hypothetical protein LX73_0632 [Fodinibius salinus]|uniref:BNR repeat-like domain-containing protein n=1 Tax=Fodinibius salinus TaxID=860790 RepID=A0A5D3YNS1_9BACT|nr:hypothetical protein [Fodinibius salinus]TYP95332.1 hypothetical protein LX73_0632 [Fodinibius salinus]